MVFLVRHGEKADLSDNPELSAAGHERAAALARNLRSAEIEYVHSSDFT
ncbi:histidine phosphatase family protein [candidate division KSB1 bacterium]|nr:histidine phosphatase family protein [candidate division KSB1 bacterium]